jgi:murein DD-endopeptidase MepM/ murein hydrolase activator NlpD
LLYFAAVARRRSIGFVLPIVLSAVIVGSLAAPGRPAGQPSPRASEYGIQIQIPGQDPVLAGQHATPPWTTSADGAFAYPADGSVLQAGTVTGRSSVGGDGTTVRAGADLTNLSLFGGEITASAVVVRAASSIQAGTGSADFTGSSVTNLVVLGQPVTVSPYARIALADWGHAYVLEEEHTGGTSGGAPTYHSWVTGIDIRLDADHDGLPVGTRILIGYADAFVSVAPPQSFTQTTPAPPPPETSTPRAAAPPPSTSEKTTTPTPTPATPTPATVLNDLGQFPVLAVPPPLQRSITAQGYVFPVYGPSGYGDTFGAPRGDVSGGWHHGDDIFAPLGAPVLAVADGVVFLVGPNPIGGNRLWLQDGAGNQYYYAHLSAYTPLARDGMHVHAGDVLGFVGNTGDAAGGPYHLHFEVHPASLLFLGYDGAVDPTPYLDAWRHLQTVSFPSGVAWAPQPLRSLVPPAGAMLLQSSDISTASGLDPESLRQAIEPHPDDALVSGGTGRAPRRGESRR